MFKRVAVNQSVAVEVTDDKLEAYLIARAPRDLAISVWEDAYMAAEIAEPYVIDLTHDLVDLLDEAQSGNSNAFPAELLLAKGIPPKHGKNSFINYIINFEENPGTVDEKTGKINFKERDLVKEVDEGDEILELIKASRGEAGFDIFGEPVPAKDGENVTTVNAGEGVIVDDMGDKVVYRAAKKGVVLLQGKEVHVSEILIIKTDVDYSTGNIRFNGSVTISGSVKSGFEVEATGDVVIEGFVEKDALVKGETIIVQSGCYGKIHARKTAQLEFLENATAFSAKHIAIKSVNRSVVVAPHVIIDKVASSRIFAYQELSIVDVNSSMATPCNLSIGYDPNALEVINHLRSEYSSLKFSVEMSKLYLANAGVNVSEILEQRKIPEGLSAEHLEKAKQLIHNLNVINRFKSVFQELISKTDGVIYILSKVDKYTILDMYGIEKQLYEQMARCSFRFDMDTYSIVEGRISADS
ncbi:protein of unknown function DUF342 [Desulfurispirillum indicum S5]|uniref:Flagellar Assembly Protein A N-terminal region domain-containing protein n=1 Tax=Desulfurispirillum indicum (strain ATCC BAA-1389 / DSM 22839 / S5) TaxID=653733 RepID=E6W0N1_DESIS|nr:FapA family protein [Desulfurispirillum indicum]ADU65283.1 protein of unknown function DUF342 [Desulfurispirillum indicum S5]